MSEIPLLDSPEEISYYLGTMEDKVYIIQLLAGKQQALVEKLQGFPFKGRVSLLFPYGMDYGGIPYMLISCVNYTDVQLLSQQSSAVIRVLCHRHVSWVEDDYGRRTREIWYEPADLPLEEALGFLSRLETTKTFESIVGRKVFVEPLGMECIVSGIDNKGHWITITGKILGAVSPVRVSWEVWKRWKRNNQLHFLEGR